MIGTNKNNNGKLWVKDSDNLPVTALSALSGVFSKYSTSNFYKDLSATRVKQVIAHEQVLGIRTSRGLVLEKIKDTPGGLSAWDSSNNLCSFASTYLSQWWVQKDQQQIFYVTLSPTWTLSWYRFDVDQNYTQTLFSSGISSLSTATPSALALCYNPITQNFNVSVSYGNGAYFGLASIMIPLKNPRIDYTYVKNLEILL